MRWPKSMDAGRDADSEDDGDYLEDETKASGASSKRQSKKGAPKVTKVKKIGKVKKTALKAK